ncbi:MAG: hypothetical protein DSZ10_03240, partial [Sulfurovum sp.]
QRTQHLHDRLEHLSPLQKLTQASLRCDRLKEEYQRMIDYQIERKRSMLKPMIQNYRNSMHFILQRKEEQIRTLQTKAQMSDPALSEKKGWAQVIKEGHPVDLDEITVDDHFVLQNTKRKVQVKALSIESLQK